MGQPKFVYDNMKAWVVAKQAAKNAVEEEGISPYLKAERERYYHKLDDWKPDYLEDSYAGD